MKVNNKVIVITGGGSGMGREMVLGLINRGAKVAAIDLHENTLKETRQLLPADKQKDMSLHVLNIVDRAAVEKLPEQIIAIHGVVDGLINNAGIIQPFVRVNELSYDTIEHVMNVNFYGTLYMVKAFIPYLLMRPEAHILNVSSMGGFLPVPGQSIYGASKAAVKLMTEGLYAELQSTNVKVSVVFPGAVSTNISVNSGIQNPGISDEQTKKYQALPAAAAAKIILDGMEKNKVQIYVGKDSRMMNLFYRLNPVGAVNMITKKMKDLLK